MKLAEHRDVPTVYEPAEDSRLLAETAIDHVDAGRVLEVGVGSGYVAERVATETETSVVGCDISSPVRGPDRGTSKQFEVI